MSKSRSGKSLLSTALELSPQPIYWLDDRLRLQFINSAMNQWLDWGDRQLPDTPMTFGSAAVDIAREFPADLAPPPQANGISPLLGTVCRHLSSSEPPQCAQAWFIPFSNPQRNERRGWLVWLDTSPLPDDLIADESIAGELNAIDLGAAEKSGSQPPAIMAPSGTQPQPWSDPLSPVAIQKQMLRLRFLERHVLPVPIAAGPSAIARRLRRQIELAGQVQMPLLIVGPPGSGRELIAKSIFARRKQRFQLQQPLLVPLHCRIADPELVQETWRQVLRTAGTEPPHLLLIEVDQISSEAAQELLGLFSIPTIKVIPIATAASTDKDSTWSQLPLDLQMTINCQTIELCRLAERPNDLPAIAQAYLESMVRSEKTTANAFAPTAVQYLLDYDWPNNAEQLQQVVEECIQNCPQPLIDSAHLPKSLLYAVQAKRQGRAAHTEIDLDKYLESIERQLLERALQQSKFNRAAAARLLNISRARFLRRCEQLEIAFPAEPIEFVPEEIEERDGHTKP